MHNKKDLKIVYIAQLNIFTYYLSDNTVVHTQPTESGHMGGGSKYCVVTFKFNRQQAAVNKSNKGVHMDIETITKLLDAGYTKADIDAMQGTDGAGGQTDESAGKENETAGKEQGDAGAKDAGKVENGDEVAAMLKTLTDTVNGLTTTVKALQDANAKGAQTKSPKATDEIKAAMDSFIEKL